MSKWKIVFEENLHRPDLIIDADSWSIDHNIGIIYLEKNIHSVKKWYTVNWQKTKVIARINSKSVVMMVEVDEK